MKKTHQITLCFVMLITLLFSTLMFLKGMAPGSTISTANVLITVPFIAASIHGGMVLVVLIALLRPKYFYPWSLIPGLINIYQLFTWVQRLAQDPSTMAEKGSPIFVFTTLSTVFFAAFIVAHIVIVYKEVGD